MINYLTAILFCLAIISPYTISAQTKLPDIYGFRHFKMIYLGDPVEILVKSKKGEENKPKPLLLFCQGSQPRPLIISFLQKGVRKIYNVFVFNTDSLVSHYHLVIIGKPFIPLTAQKDSLKNDLTYLDRSSNYPELYRRRNYPDYYVHRDIEVLQLLGKLPWVSSSKLVVAGHSEGAGIASQIASDYPAVTELIYACGSPLGRMISIVERSRREETDSTHLAENQFEDWRQICADPKNLLAEGDSNKDAFQNSWPPPVSWLTQLKIPVLVSFGTKDQGATVGNDYLRLEAIRLKKTNFTFNGYIGLEHNFFPLTPDGKIDEEKFGWDRVAIDWNSWLKNH